MTTSSSTTLASAVDAPDSFATMPHLDRAQAWVDAARSAENDERRSECWAEAAHAFAEAGAHESAVQALDELLAIADLRVRVAQRGVDAASLLADHGRALRLYTFVLPSISLDEKRASTALTLADEAVKIGDRPLERFFLHEAMSVQRSEDLLARFAHSAVLSAREETGLDDDERAQAILSLIHLARRHQAAAGYTYASSALELDPRNDDALELFVDRGLEAKLQDDVRAKLESALFVLGAERQGRALGRLEAALDDRPTGALPDAAPSMSSIVDVDELATSGASAEAARDPRVEALLAEAASFKSFPSLHVAKLREVLVLDPLEREALSEMRAILDARGDHEGLRDVLVEASDTAKTRGWPVAKRLPIVRELAELCAGPLDDPFGAIDALEELVRADAKNSDARAALRGHLERVGRWEAVVALVEEGLAAAPNPEDILAELARLHLDKRRDASSAATALLRRAQLLNSDVGAWREVLQLVRPLRDRVRLEAILVEALRAIGTTLTTTERSALGEELANLRRASGDVASAEQLYSDAALATRDARLFAAAEACALELGALERAARAALAQADLAAEGARAGHLVRAAAHFAQGGGRKLALATLRDAVGAGASASGVHDVVLACAAGDGGETFDWAATLALRTQRDRAAWLTLAEKLAPGHERASRAIPLVKELLRLGPTPERLQLLSPMAWTSDDELRSIVEAVATGSDVAHALRLEAALLSADALRMAGDRGGALRVLRMLPKPVSTRIVRELLELGAGVLNADEELGLVEQALAASEGDGTERKSWLERAATLAHDRRDGRRELGYVLALLDLDPEDFDRIARATALARSSDDAEVLDRCLARAIDVEADDETLGGLVRERALLLARRFGRKDEAAALVANHAATNPELRTLWVELASKAGNLAAAATALANFEGLSPAEAAFDAWLEALPSSPEWLTLAEASHRVGAVGSRRSIAIALARGDAAHARALFTLLGPTADAPHAVAEARGLHALGLHAEAFASVEAHVRGATSENVDELLGFALEIAPTPGDAVALLRRAPGLGARAFHDALESILRAASGEGPSLVALLEGAGDRLDAEFLAERTNDVRVAEALALLGTARPLATHRAIVVALERLAAPAELQQIAIAALFATYPETLRDNALGSRLDRVAVLERAFQRSVGASRDSVGVALVEALLAAGALEEAQKTAQTLADGSGNHRELLERVLEARGLVNELVASLEKRWSLEKDQARRIAIARRIADALETSNADPRETADAWRRVLRLDPKDGDATAALERAKARALGSMPRMSASLPPAPPSSIAAIPSVIATPLPLPVAARRDDEAVESTPRALFQGNALEAADAVLHTSIDGDEAAAASEATGVTEVGEATASLPSAPTSLLDLADVEDGDEALDSDFAEDLAQTTNNPVDESAIPEALASSELLDDALLESMPDAEEING